MNIDDPTPKSFLDHLEDLRWVIIKGIAVLLVGTVACLAATKPLLELLYVPLRHAGQNPDGMLRALGVVDPLAIQIELGLTGGVILALPFLLYFIAGFLLPGLTRREARVILPALGLGAFLFMGGVVFCYYLILPQTLRWFDAYNRYLGIRTDWTIQNYIDFVLQMLLAFGVSFEMPLVLVILNALGIVPSAALKHYRRHVFLGIVVMACCVVPSTDPFSLGMLIVPMYVLFELTILATGFLEKKKVESADWPDQWPTGPQD